MGHLNGNGRAPEAYGRAERRTVTNPTMSLSPALGDIAGAKGTVSGSATPLMQQMSQGIAQGLASRRGSPLGIVEGLSITTARSVPASVCIESVNHRLVIPLAWKIHSRLASPRTEICLGRPASLFVGCFPIQTSLSTCTCICCLVAEEGSGWQQIP